MSGSQEAQAEDPTSFGEDWAMHSVVLVGAFFFNERGRESLLGDGDLQDSSSMHAFSTELVDLMQIA